jgi:magnesium-transporting ATPase (P-type)
MAYQLAAGARAFRRVLTPLQRQAAATIRILLVCYIGLALLMTSTIRQTPLVDRVQMSVVRADLIPNGLLLSIAVAYALGAVRLASKGVLIQQAKLGSRRILCLWQSTRARRLSRAIHIEDEPLGSASIPQPAWQPLFVQRVREQIGEKQRA